MNFIPTIDPRLCGVIVLVFCIGIFWSCFCRLRVSSRSVFIRVRFKYAVLMGGSVALGLQPLLFAHWPGPGAAIFSSAVFIYLVCGMHRWRHGPPADQMSQPAELNPE